MRRRKFIAGAAATAALGFAQAVCGQTGARSGGMKRLAIVHPAEPPERLSISGRRAYKAYFVELSRLGYVEGKNLIIERYSGDGRPEHYEDVARAIVASHPDLIISISGRITVLLKSLTTTIPILATSADPVASGIVTSMASPEGNITGISADAGVELWGKRLQLLRETVGKLANARVLMPTSVVPFWEAGIAPVLRRAGTSIKVAEIAGKLDQEAYERAFDAMETERVDGLIVGDAPDLETNSQVIVSLAAKYRLPTIYPYREYVDNGGLFSYGIDRAEMYRRLADMTDHVLKGASPGDIPYEQHTKFELLLNRKTARSLGLEFPPTLLTAAAR
jgi:putative ABC transport system substrate-binding protein